MQFELRTYSCRSKPGSFYIQSKGLHAGRPLEKPIANCFVVYTDTPLLYERVYSLFVGRFFEPHIGGSVVPFIRIDDVRHVITEALRQENDFRKELQSIQQVDKMLQCLQEQMKLYKMMRLALCRKINSA
jgi:hypothetical protein